MVKALLVPKATYGINYLRLTKAQGNGLEVLNREAIKVITGLSKYTRMEELYQIAGLNIIEEIARENKTSKMLRLQKTKSGKKILKELGFGTADYPVMADPPPPWEDEVVVDRRPTSQNRGIDQRK